MDPDLFAGPVRGVPRRVRLEAVGADRDAVRAEVDRLRVDVERDRVPDARAQARVDHHVVHVRLGHHRRPPGGRGPVDQRPGLLGPRPRDDREGARVDHARGEGPLVERADVLLPDGGPEADRVAARPPAKDVPRRLERGGPEDRPALADRFVEVERHPDVRRRGCREVVVSRALGIPGGPPVGGPDR